MLRFKACRGVARFSKVGTARPETPRSIRKIPPSLREEWIIILTWQSLEADEDRGTNVNSSGGMRTETGGGGGK